MDTNGNIENSNANGNIISDENTQVLSGGKKEKRPRTKKRENPTKPRNTKNKTVKKKGGSVNLGIKFMLTRILNPGNVDRFLYKNSEFLEFIDIEAVKKLHETKQIGFGKTNAPIGIMRSDIDGKYYIYKQTYIDKKLKNEKPSAEDKPLPEGNQPPDNNADGEPSQPGEQPVSAADENAAKDMNDNIDKKLEQEDKIKNKLFGKIKNFAAATKDFMADSINRYTFLHLNDKPLVAEKGMAEGKNMFGMKKNHLYFYDVFEPLFRVLHIYKYQMNRIYFTPGGFYNFARIRYILKRIFHMINEDNKLRDPFKEEIYNSLKVAAFLSGKDNVSAPINKRVIDGVNDAKEPLSEFVVTETDEDGNTLVKTGLTEEEAEKAEEAENTEGTDKQTGGFMGFEINNISRRLINHLLKNYDFNSPINLSFNKLKSFYKKEKPKYVENEVKLAVLFAINLLKPRKLMDEIENNEGLSEEEKQEKLEELKNQPQNKFFLDNRENFSHENLENLENFTFTENFIIKYGGESYLLKDIVDMENQHIIDKTNSHTTINDNRLKLITLLESKSIKDWVEELKQLYLEYKKQHKGGNNGGTQKKRKGKGKGKGNKNRTQKAGMNFGIRNFIRKTSDSVKSNIHKLKSNIFGDYTEYFMRATEHIFFNSYKFMFDRMMKRVLLLRGETPPQNQYIKDVTMDTHIVTFFLRLYRRTTILWLYFMGTLLFNILSVFYSPTPQFLASFRLYFEQVYFVKILLGKEKMTEIVKIANQQFCVIKQNDKPKTKTIENIVRGFTEVNKKNISYQIPDQFGFYYITGTQGNNIYNIEATYDETEKKTLTIPPGTIITVADKYEIVRKYPLFLTYFFEIGEYDVYGKVVYDISKMKDIGDLKQNNTADGTEFCKDEKKKIVKSSVTNPADTRVDGVNGVNGVNVGGGDDVNDEMAGGSFENIKDIHLTHECFKEDILVNDVYSGKIKSVKAQRKNIGYNIKYIILELEYENKTNELNMPIFQIGNETQYNQGEKQINIKAIKFNRDKGNSGDIKNTNPLLQTISPKTAPPQNTSPQALLSETAPVSPQPVTATTSSQTPSQISTLQNLNGNASQQNENKYEKSKNAMVPVGVSTGNSVGDLTGSLGGLCVIS